MKRHAKLTPHARRLTPIEVAQHWFRRGADYVRQIHAEHPNFPKPGPDGLFLLSHVESWFDLFHGTGKMSVAFGLEGEEDRAMRAALG